MYLESEKRGEARVNAQRLVKKLPQGEGRGEKNKQTGANLFLRPNGEEV